MSDVILLEKIGRTAVMTINRPDKANSLTHEMLSELAGIMESAQSARAVILTGSRAARRIA